MPGYPNGSGQRGNGDPVGLLCKYSLRTEPWGLVNFGVGVDGEEPASDGEGQPCGEPEAGIIHFVNPSQER